MKNKESYIIYWENEMEKTEITIHNVFVSKNERGQGKGKELVQEAIDFAQDNGYSTVGLCAEPQTEDGLDAEALICFYESIGFVQDGDCAELMTYSI